ncbi:MULTISPECIES: type II secretion system protein J [Flavobacteriaceae]|uniref:PulJ/GspJ family protein n=1 Tax=Flavobacteriaceae TaxID=49546 RepID=UPI0039E7F47F
MNIKLKSYTIIELLVSMLIISVVVLVSYAFFSSLTNQLNVFTETEEKLLEYAYFKNLLKREVFESKEINIGKESVSIQYNDREVKYVVKKKVVYRICNSNVDTFFIDVKRISPILSSDSKYNNTVKGVLVDVSLLGGSTKLFLSKRYGADILINNFFNNEN